MRISREKMVRILQKKDDPVKNPEVLKAMMNVPRHLFVGEDFRARAYDDGPLPIGKNQTISQPYMVAKMTELLKPKKGDAVLEIGTGSGYQSAVLAEIVDKVYTIERIPELAEAAKKKFDELGYRNINVRIGDGSVGWPEMGPFDGIIVTAGCPEIPEPLLEQLKEDGRLAVPVGSMSYQELIVVTKRKDGYYVSKKFGCIFVPLIGIRGWKQGGN
ncbi:protein-L-isoaspartate(D-aspartate) O-methyltransferase [candidate division WOR-3 bacterium]|nr:protein-L-isoaspartate(D-aspartate) O-methyltransferase [candidate division WOR-3 bacterium]